MYELKSTHRQIHTVYAHTSKYALLRISSVWGCVCMCAYVSVNIICVASDIKFNKKFTFQIESTTSVKCVDPQTAISSVSVKHVRKCKPQCRFPLNGINCKILQALCLIGPSMIFSYRSLEDLLILIFHERISWAGFCRLWPTFGN